MKGRDVLLVSMRGRAHAPAYTAWYEFEDLIQEWEGAELLELPHGFDERTFTVPRSAYQLLRSIGLNEDRALRSVDWVRSNDSERSEYDLIILTVSGFFDLFAVNRLRSLLAPTGKLVGLVIEVWPAEVKQRATSLEPIDQFDHLFVATSSGATALGGYLGRPVEHLSPAGDVLTSSAGTRDGQRPVGVVNPGRRSSHQHQSLLAACTEAERLYVYDTIIGGEVHDSTAHRISYNTLLRHSELLVCNYAKFDQANVIEDEREIPGRFFEGIAAGNVLIGELPSDEALRQSGVAGVSSVEMPLKGAGPNIAELLDDQRSLDAAKRTNRMLAASGHDWAHRWLRILEHVGLSPTALTTARLDALRSIASTGTQTGAETSPLSAEVSRTSIGFGV